MSKFIDITNLRFGRLVARAWTRNQRGFVAWQCECDCGNRVIVRTGALKSGQTTSCGCYRDELRRIRPLVHGKRKTPEYAVWHGIKSRCFNTKCAAYSRYGGRGISMCDQWRDSFERFVADVGERPSPDHSLDRINNDGNYEPGNVRWATDSEQNRNTRRNLLIYKDGKSLLAIEWAALLGLPLHLIYRRHYRGLRGEELLRPVGHFRAKEFKKLQYTREKFKAPLK